MKWGLLCQDHLPPDSWEGLWVVSCGGRGGSGGVAGAGWPQEPSTETQHRRPGLQGAESGSRASRQGPRGWQELGHPAPQPLASAPPRWACRERGWQASGLARAVTRAAPASSGPSWARLAPAALISRCPCDVSEPCSRTWGSGEVGLLSLGMAGGSSLTGWGPGMSGNTPVTGACPSRSPHSPG